MVKIEEISSQPTAYSRQKRIDNINILGKNEENNQDTIKKIQLYFKLFLTYFISFLQLAYILTNIFINFIKNLLTAQEKSVENEVILITGSGGYLGRSLATQFAKRGVSTTLILWDINEEENKKTFEEVRLTGCKNVHMFTVDLSNESNLKSVAKQVKENIGDVSMVLMAAAPNFTPKSVLDLNYKDDIEKQFIICYMSQLWLIQEFLKPMISQKHGHLITISSSSAYIDMPLITGYASFKLAQTKLMETVREELAANGVTGVNTSIVFLNILEQGLAENFKDSFVFNLKVAFSADAAAENIVNGVLRNESIIFIPKYHRLIVCFKYLLSPKIVGFISSKVAKINENYLKLKNKYY